MRLQLGAVSQITSEALGRWYALLQLAWLMGAHTRARSELIRGLGCRTQTQALQGPRLDPIPATPGTQSKSRMPLLWIQDTEPDLWRQI